MKNQWLYKVSSALLIVMLAVAALPVTSAYAAGPVAVLNAWPAAPQMTGTTGNPANVNFAISNGTERLLLVLISSYDLGGATGQTFTATYGGKTLTQAFLQNNNRRQTWIGYLNEANISTRTGDAVTVTVTGVHTNVVAYIASYSGVNQTTPITGNNGVYINNQNNQTIGGPLAVNAGGYAIYGWSGTGGTTRTSDTETFTENSDVNNAATFNYGVASKAFAAAANANPSVAWLGNNRVSVSFITLNPAPAVTAFAVTYALGGGTGTLPTQANVNTGATFTVASGAGITRAGYTFAGWNDGAATYAAGSTYTMGASNVTLTAQWTPLPHTVTYALGGGTGTLPTQANVNTGATFTVASGAGITRAGYTFAGWNDGAATYAAGSTYTMGVNNVTLTAQWTPLPHTVTYALGGGTGTLPTQANVTTGGTFTVASGAGLTRVGFTFAGWNDGAATYAAGSTYTMGVNNVTLTAQWTSISHTVTYALGGGTGTLPTQANVNTGSTFTVAGGAGLTRAGYTFAGWNDGAANYAAGSTYTMGVNNVILTAQWTPIPHTVTYALGGGTGTLPTQANVVTGGTFTVASGAGLTRVGYTFAGWNDGAATYAAGSTYTMGINNVTLTAQWTPTPHTVTYALGGGAGTLPTQANVVTGGTFTVASGAGLTRAGYTFAGWNDGAANYAAGSTYTVGINNVTLTAQWTPTSQSVTYALGGGAGTLPTQANVTTGGTFTVAAGAGLTRAGYTFAGWNDGAANYAAGSTYTMGASNVTLTAQWTPTSQSVTYALGGGTGTLPTQANVNTGATFTVASGAGLSLTGYTFTGWNDGAANYAAGSTYTMGASNVTLTAQWTINTYTLTYTAGANGSLTGTSPQTVNYATDGTAVTAVADAGYHFVDWSDGSTVNPRTDTNVQANVTVTANFAINPVSPTFTSGNTTTFDAGFAGSFNVTATGIPSSMTIVSAGALPSGVTLVDNGNGTAVLGGTPAVGTSGTYNLVFTANNGTAPNGIQNFTLIIKNGPTIGANGINSTPDTGDNKVSENESIIDTLGITKLTVEFSQDVYDDPADATDYGHDVTNPANYILVRSATGTFATIDCAGGVVAPDINISVDSVSYSNGGGTGPFVSTLSINGGLPLNVVGFYRLYVCGTTSIVDANNRNLELAGNGTTPGTDYLRNFRIATAVVNGGGNGNASSSAKKTVVTNGFLIPVTGFAPNQITALPAQPADKVYTSMGQMTIEIPTLGVKFPIVGASIANKTWDLTWLKDSVAYLEGSAYPTTAGNTVLTAHVQDANKNLGPFSDIKGMELGQKIYIHVNGQIYVYQVEENSKISSNNIEAMFKHEENSWITLVTCEDYNAKTGVYSNRRMVRAVLISVIFEK